MTGKERFLKALNRETADRLPVTTHHLQNYFKTEYMEGKNDQDCFDDLGLDPIYWIMGNKAEGNQTLISGDTPRIDGVVESPEWKIGTEELSDPRYRTIRYTIHTPSGNLSTIIQYNSMTGWQTEHLVKEKNDIDIIIKHAPFYKVDPAEIRRTAEICGDRGLVRGHIPGFEPYGQPGCWQDMACLVGIEKLILATFDDPEWVHTLLTFLRDRKLHYIRSLKDAPYDLLELGGGDASTTVISPDIFRNFVAPYDRELITAAEEADKKIVYHTCGGMMPILEDIADMGPAAMETLTPPGMGGDVDLAEAKRRVGDRVCLIGGYDQGLHFLRSTPQEARRAVREAFEAAGEGGGFILSPSDHFFDADPALIRAFAEEAKKCLY